jgi:mannose-6-phosphate isomerase
VTERTDVRSHADMPDGARAGSDGGADQFSSTGGVADPARAHAGPHAAILPPNRLARFYAGGARIDRMRGSAANGPEEWVGSTTAAFGDPVAGLSRLADGGLLRDAIDADPVGFLGDDHVARWGTTPALLVKLLDAGERLPVHFHPGRAFAREALGLEFGKTEAWIIVEADPGAVVHLGLKAPVTAEEVGRWVAEQDVAAMLDALYELPAAAGDVFFVPAGTLHSIGAGILMVELQEPTDLSVLLEWERFGVSTGEEHLRLGWERALGAIDRAPADPGGLRAKPANGAVTELLPERAAPFFGAERVTVADRPVSRGSSFAILVVLDGRVTVGCEDGQRLELAPGQTALIPHAAGTTTIEGRGTIIRCLPPKDAP